MCVYVGVKIVEVEEEIKRYTRHIGFHSLSFDYVYLGLCRGCWPPLPWRVAPTLDEIEESYEHIGMNKRK